MDRTNEYHTKGNHFMITTKTDYTNAVKEVEKND